MTKDELIKKAENILEDYFPKNRYNLAVATKLVHLVQNAEIETENLKLYDGNYYGKTTIGIR